MNRETASGRRSLLATTAVRLRGRQVITNRLLPPALVCILAVACSSSSRPVAQPSPNASSPPPPTSTPTAATPRQSPPATAWVPVSVTFVNAQTGWLLAIPDVCTQLLHGAPACPPRVEISPDGGSHWRVLASPAFPAST